MTRKTPVPEVAIAADIFEDLETGENIANIIIDVKVGEYSNGLLFLDEPGDLHILRTAIDDYIKRNKIQPPQLDILIMGTKQHKDDSNKGSGRGRQPKADPVDATAVILGSYLQGYLPVDSFGPGVAIMTTDDIIAALADMADLSQRDVNRFLAANGFNLGRNSSGLFGWMMKRADI